MGDKELHLTSTEYKLLCLMAKNTGKVLTHTYITQKVWGSSWEMILLLYVYLWQLYVKNWKANRMPRSIYRPT